MRKSDDVHRRALFVCSVSSHRALGSPACSFSSAARVDMPQIFSMANRPKISANATPLSLVMHEFPPNVP